MMSDYVNLLTVGLSLSIVGVIFLANSMTIRRPRRLLHEVFGVRRPQRLASVLDELHAKAQIFSGFLALLAGFSLQISAAITGTGIVDTEGVPPAALAWERAQALSLLAVGIVVVTVALKLLQNLWAGAEFRRMVGDLLAEHPERAGDTHPALVRELGDLLDIELEQDETIGDYVARVRAALSLDDAPGAPRRDRAIRPADDEDDEEPSA